MTNHLYPRDEVEARRGPVTVTDPVVAVPTEDLRALFDVAVGSLNFASGFLDTDEVDALRRVAVLIGVDPRAGTPTEFAKRTAHAHTPEAPSWPDGPCKWCGRYNGPNDDDRHPAADEVRAP